MSEDKNPTEPEMIPLDPGALLDKLNSLSKTSDVYTGLMVVPYELGFLALMDCQFKEIAKALGQTRLAFSPTAMQTDPSRSASPMPSPVS